MSRPPYAGDGSHTSSYYAASANPSPERPELQGDHEIDVCIVGAGYSGLSTGLHLAEKGYKVAIIEGARVGWGASGRTGGQIVNGLNASLQTIKRRYGQDTATFVAGLVQEGGEIIRERVRTYDIKCDLKEKNIFTGLTPAHMRELEERQKLWQSYGIDNQEMLDKDQLRAHINSDLYEGGLIDHSGGHMHPLNLALGEAAAFEKNGGTIYEMSPVTDVYTLSLHDALPISTRCCPPMPASKTSAISSIITVCRATNACFSGAAPSMAAQTRATSRPSSSATWTRSSPNSKT